MRSAPTRRSALRGKAAVANGKLAYARFLETFSGPRWDALAARGARVQRPLWASTSTKNPDYPDTLYVDELIGPDTVNTLPDNTLEAFEDHGTVARTIDAGLDEARDVMARLAAVGVDIDDVTRQLEDEGVAAFEKSFDELLTTLGDQGGGTALMDPSYSTEAEEFREKIQAFLAEKLPSNWKGIGALERDEAAAFTNEWRRTLAENRYLAPAWPTEYGGGGLSELEQVVLAEEFQRAGVPTGEPQRLVQHPDGRQHDPAVGHRRAEGPLPPAHHRRRRRLVPGLLRARRRIRSRRPRLPGRASTATSG